jgi:hypothetical protein
MRTLSFFISLFTFIACAQAQVDVSIHMHQKLGDQPFAYNTVVQTAAGYYIKVSRLQYYISEVKLIHDGGQITPVTDVYFLVTPTKDSIFELGNFDITNLESIEYSLGVDPGHNHLDPASYPASHPLAPKNPTMHWGWAAGYRFIAFEGFGGATSGAVTNNYQIHTVDDSNYKTLALNTTGTLEEGHLTVHVTADYLKVFEGINVQSGLISHASTGASKKQMDNMQTLVFTADQSTAIHNPVEDFSFSITPNPSQGSISLSCDLSNFKKAELIVTNLYGEELLSQDIPCLSSGQVVHTGLPGGFYFASLRGDGRIVASQKIAVQY